MRRKFIVSVCSVLLAVSVFVIQENIYSADVPAKLRPGEWAQPIKKSGLPNFHKVSDSLYRGAQPTEAGMRELKKLGIKTIISLRSFHSDRNEMKKTDFNYVHIYMKAWNPEDHEVVLFLKTMADPANHPVFLHCMHGADRTGTMAAIYRMTIQGWPREKAIEEMLKGGFGYHPVWDKYLIPYLRKIDIEKFKREAEIKD